MISNSCLQLIALYFKNISTIDIIEIKLGTVSLNYDKNKISLQEINKHFAELGFIEIVNPDEVLLEKIKLAAIELIYLSNNTNSLIRNSDYISERVQVPYAKISKVFSSITQITLEKYLILLKVEKTKALIIQDEFSFSEISYTLGYSSVQYLSNQFKKITGYTLTQFKNLKEQELIPLENLV